MQDPDSTHRHNHLGGVRVTDLLRRSGRYERLARAVLSGEHGDSAQSLRPARTSIAVAGIALLCAAVTVLAVILRLGTSTDQPADARAEPAAATPVTGVPALSPDVLRSDFRKRFVDPVVHSTRRAPGGRFEIIEVIGKTQNCHDF